MRKCSSRELSSGKRRPAAASRDCRRPQVAAARLYTGPPFQPINAALRTRDTAAWATTIACLFSAVLKLSYLSKPARVYRGVKEDKLKLTYEFLHPSEGGFAGGVEVPPLRPEPRPSRLTPF